MASWIKLGRIFNPSDVKGRWWMKEFAQAPCTLIFDKFVRVFFSTRPGPDVNGQYVSYTGYVDLNRKNLMDVLDFSKEPVMDLGGLGAFDEFGIYPFSAIRKGAEVWGYYGGWTRCQSVPYNVSIGLAISKDDGATFHRVGPGPLLSFSLDEPMTISGPKIRQFEDGWYLWYVAGNKWIRGVSKPESVFKIRMAFSTDGVHWQRINRDLIPNRLEENECQASPDVLFLNGTYHMFFCYKYSFDFRNRERGYRIGYAYSKDRLHWTRNDALAGISISDQGWDSEMVSYPHVFQLDGRIYMMYLGNQVGKTGFGLAQLEGTL